MQTTVCPLFRKDEELCDVGTGYIFAGDVRHIACYCSSRFSECPRYAELSQRRMRPQPRPRPLVAPFSVRWPLSFRIQYLSGRYFDSPIHPKEETRMNTHPTIHKGWAVVLAGLGINLALGILYAWSIFKGAIVDSIAAGGPFTWDKAAVNDPYAVACLAFAFAMIVAGRMQDKFGPRLTAILGGLLVGAGFVVISQTTNYWAWVAGFGILTGCGLGFGYSAATPPALKWFSPAKTGLIAGIVVSGFGLASIYIAPLSKYLLGAYGLQQAMLIFGIAFTVVVCGLAMFVQNPPAGYVPFGVAPAGSMAAKKAAVADVGPREMLRSPRFYTLWSLFFIGSGAGLMVIGSAKGLADKSMGEKAFLVVAIMAVGNAAGRIIAGVVSDKIGRSTTLAIMLGFQAVLMFAALPILSGGNPVLVTLLVSMMVFNYGTNLALFPSFAKDYWGSKNYGLNYGLLFTAWGVGGLVLTRIAEMLKAASGSFTSSFLAAGVMLAAGTLMTLTLREPKSVVAEEKVVAAVEEEYEEEDLVLD